MPLGCSARFPVSPLHTRVLIRSFAFLEFASLSPVPPESLFPSLSRSKMSLSKLSSLSKLPSEVLSSVLNNPAIPLVRRLHLRLLSNRWCDIIEDGLKKTTSLAICEENNNDDNIRNCKPNDLLIKSGGLTTELSRILVRLFPGITELTLAFGWQGPSWPTVPTLLAHMATNLTALKLYGSIWPSEYEPLARALATLSGLTCLTLHGDHLTAYLLSLLGPVFSRLEKFACPYSGAWPSAISSSLSPRCTHLQLDHNVFTAISGPFLAQLSTSVTHLHLVSCSKTPNWNSLSQMNTLTSLTLDLNYSSLDSSLFSPLVSFASYTHVKLYGLHYHAPLALPTEKETPLPGIKRLTLETIFYPDASQFDYQLFFQAIGAWFPSLAHFTLFTQVKHISAIRANLGKLPFAAEILDFESADTSSPDW